MRAGEIIAAAFWLAVAAGVTWAGAGLGLGTLSDPGPGGMIFWVGVVMTGLSLATLAVALRQPAGSGLASLWQGTRWWLVPYVVALLALYAWLLPALGFRHHHGAAPAHLVHDHRSAKLDRAAARRGPHHGSGLHRVPSPARHPAARRRGRAVARRVPACDIRAGVGRWTCCRTSRSASASRCSPINLLYCFLGVFIGTLVGVLPGIGPVAAMSLLLPVTFTATPEAGIIMLAGIYYGSMYGGSTTAILVNIPGEAASVVTTLDGHQMARQGRAGPALGIAAIGSFIAGTLAIVGLMLVAPTLARFAVKFGPAEYFSLMVLGLSILAYLSHGSLLKALIMACFGLMLGLVGLDSISAVARLTFDRMELVDGVGLVPIVMGLFGIAEILVNIEQKLKREMFKERISGLLPSRKDWAESAGPLARGSLLGFLFGILPGGGAVIASFLSYALEKRVSQDAREIRQGRDCRRRRARGCQQRRGRQRLHPAA